MLKRFKILTRIPRGILGQWFNRYKLELNNPGLYLAYPTTLQYTDLSLITVGTEVIIGSFSEIVVISESSFSSIPGVLKIGDRVVIGSHANIRATGGSITLGNNVLIAQNVSLIAANHLVSNQYPYRDLPWGTEKVGIEIGENVWIGASVTVLPGCKIGVNAVIGAGSIVTKSIPANEIWVGNPAKKLRSI
jgi:acetyltransferase-like isoleucine patch superfamily enzyme